MPTYAYRCPACGSEFDVFQRISDPAGAPCPRCRTQAERVITGGGGVLFKGGGFHQTDYRSESYRKAAKSEGGESGKTGGATPAKEGAARSEPAEPAKPAAKDKAKDKGGEA